MRARRFAALVAGAIVVGAIVFFAIALVVGPSPKLNTHFVHDDAHHVSCWTLSSSSISCLPDSQVFQP